MSKYRVINGTVTSSTDYMKYGQIPYVLSNVTGGPLLNGAFPGQAMVMGDRMILLFHSLSDSMFEPDRYAFVLTRVPFSP